MSGRGLYNTSSTFDLSNAAQQINLFFQALINAGKIGSLDGTIPLTTTPSLLGNAADTPLGELFTGAGAQVYSYTFEQAGYILKLAPFLIGLQSTALGNVAWSVSAILRYPDQRGDQPLYPSQTITVNAVANTAIASFCFSTVALNLLIPAGTKLVITISGTSTAGLNQILSNHQGMASLIQLKFASIPDTSLQYVNTRRIS